MCYPIISRYFCDILEGEEMSGIIHGGNILPCLRCLLTCDNIQALLKSPQRQTGEIDRAYF